MQEDFSQDIVSNENLAWLTHPALVYEAIVTLQSRDDKCVSHETLLSLTPMLERSLGNVLYTSNSKLKIPSLMRDLINTKELYDLIGSRILWLILHVMVGTPQGEQKCLTNKLFQEKNNNCVFLFYCIFLSKTFSLP